MLPHLAVESFATLVVRALAVGKLARSLALHVQHLSLTFFGLVQLLDLLFPSAVQTETLTFNECRGIRFFTDCLLTGATFHVRTNT